MCSGDIGRLELQLPPVDEKPGIEFSSKLPDFKSLVGNLNDHISKTILDLAKSTKITNEKLKNMINS